MLTPKSPTRVSSPTSKDCTQNFVPPPDGNSCDLGEESLAGFGHSELVKTKSSHLVRHHRRSAPPRLLTGGLLVRVQPEEPITTFAPIREHIERPNVSGGKTSAIERGVRYDRFHETRLFVDSS